MVPGPVLVQDFGSGPVLVPEVGPDTSGPGFLVSGPVLVPALVSEHVMSRLYFKLSYMYERFEVRFWGFWSKIPNKVVVHCYSVNLFVFSESKFETKRFACYRISLFRIFQTKFVLQ